MHTSEQHRTPPPTVNHPPHAAASTHPPPTDVTTGRRTRREDPKPDHLFVSGLGTGTTSLPCRGQKMVPSWGNGVGVLAVF